MGLVAYSSSAGAMVGRQLADLGIPLVLKGELPRLVEALRASTNAVAALVDRPAQNGNGGR